MVTHGKISAGHFHIKEGVAVHCGSRIIRERKPGILCECLLFFTCNRWPVGFSCSFKKKKDKKKTYPRLVLSTSMNGTWLWCEKLKLKHCDKARHTGTHLSLIKNNCLASFQVTEESDWSLEVLIFWLAGENTESVACLGFSIILEQWCLTWYSCGIYNLCSFCKLAYT